MERSSHVQLLDGSVVELDSRSRTAILNSLNELSSSALRVLGFAYKEDPPEFTTYNGDEDHPAHNLLLDPTNYSKIESNLIFAGLAGLRVSAFSFLIFRLLLYTSWFCLGGQNGMTTEWNKSLHSIMYGWCAPTSTDKHVL